MHVVIMGCGRVGASMAAALERLDHTVAVIDKDQQAFRRLGPDFHGQQVIGRGFDRQVLIEAGIVPEAEQNRFLDTVARLPRLAAEELGGLTFAVDIDQLATVTARAIFAPPT